VSRHSRSLSLVLVAAFAAVALAACGSSSSSPSSTSGSSTTTSSSSTTSSSTTTTSQSGGTVTIAAGVYPQSLDPQMDYTTQGSEINWLAYTGLTTYAHANGTAGTQVIPGLCTSLPTVTDNGLTYSCTLRKGIEFSNGDPVVASDFSYTLERAIKMPWGGSGLFITPIIKGGTAYSKGKASTISGVTTDDSTGKITMHLTQADGPWDNILAFPALGLIDPKTAPMPAKNQPTDPPAGAGPYEVVKSSITPTSYTAIPNPKWASYDIPGIPAGKVTVNWKVDANVTANAEAVLNNTADFFDWADVIPGSLLPQIKAQAADRFGFKDLGGSTYYIFMNSQEPPFNNKLAREAVVTGLDEQAFNKLGSGTLLPACFFLPPYVPGHPPSGTKCPYSNANFSGNLAKAKALLQQSGEAGANVTVWSQERPPRQQWMTYYTSYLNQLGFHATQKLIADANYWTTIGNLKLHPQTGFADWNMDYPNPFDFYLLLTKQGILPTNNENFGEVQDPKIDSEVAKLNPVPTSQLSTVASQWQSLDEYTAQQAYVAVFGYQTFPEFTSDKVNYGSLVFQPEYGWDWTSFSLK
jgi:peptide/nickel transport system substrate-binding protein